MQTPHIFVAAAPEGAQLRCAVAYLASDRDAYGWFIGRRHDGSYAAAYFLLQDFFANAPTRYDSAADPHADWMLDEARRHELAQLQELFSREWLTFGDDGVAVRPERIGKLADNTFYSPNFQRPVLRHLTRRWPIEYRPNLVRTAAKQKARQARHARP